MKFDSTSLTLLARVRNQQEDAWDRLVELYALLVHHWCRRSELSTEDAADIFQEVFRSVAEHITAFQKDQQQGTFRGWLRTITANKIRDHFRRRSGKIDAIGGTDAQLQMQAVPDHLLDEDDEREANVMQQSLRRALEWIRDDFEPKTWQAFWKLQIEEQDSADIAAELEMTPAAVRKAKYRVLRRLREELEGLVD